VYIEEEQEILREAFRVVLPVVDPSVEPVKVTGARYLADGRTDELVGILNVLSPDVVLLGVKTLENSAVEALRTIRNAFPHIGFVVLCAYYSQDTSKHLKSFLKQNSRRGAYLYKHSVDSVAEFSRVIHAVAEGRLIIDPDLFQSLMVENNIQNSVLKALTARELEIINWMAKGYKNAAIAEVLSLEVKTVENHINNIFSKLSEYIPNARHARVAAVISYLKATGSMTTDLSVVDWDIDTSEEDTTAKPALDALKLEPVDGVFQQSTMRFS
jgi:DNA-binding NarL/FixJ family response regulator